MCASLVAISLASSPRTVHAQPANDSATNDGPSPEARAANKRALELFKDGNYPEALDQFQKAYDLSPSWIILCNIGKTSRFTQDFARSLVAYKKCLNDGGADVDPPQRTEVEQAITQIQSLVGWATLAGEAGAEVRVDGKVVGTLPLHDKLAVNPGPRTFDSVKDTRRSERLVTVKASESVDVDLSFEASDRPKVPDPAGFQFPKGLVVATWIASGAFAATAIGTGTAALVTSSSLKSTVYVGPAQAPQPGSQIEAQAQRVGALATATDVFIAAAAVSAGVAVSFTIVNAAMTKPQDQKAAAQHVRVRVGPAALSLSGDFR